MNNVRIYEQEGCLQVWNKKILRKYETWKWRNHL